jgi:CRP-like cAMP-binding protein
MRRVNLPAGKTLFRKGEKTRETYIIMDGTIEISSDLLSVDLGKNELFGESKLAGNNRQADAIAKTGCRLFAATVDELRDAINTAPNTALLLVQALIQRLATTLSGLEADKKLIS